MSVLKTIRYNLSNLATFRGRESRGQFWPYAALVFVFAIVGIMAVMLPEISVSMERMQKFAAKHPELATVQQGPGSYSISIQGNHPELMPDMGNMMGMMAIVFVIVVALFAAAVARRLHDRGKSGVWGLLPLPFIIFASVMMPRVFAQNPPDMGLFFVIFINNMFYIASLIFLVVLLAGAGSKGENRYGIEPVP
jgi:uncharacterized membrane protein YhaH (DUF805 family)